MPVTSSEGAALVKNWRLPKSSRLVWGVGYFLIIVAFKLTVLQEWMILAGLSYGELLRFIEMAGASPPARGLSPNEVVVLRTTWRIVESLVAASFLGFAWFVTRGRERRERQLIAYAALLERQAKERGVEGVG